MRLTRRESTGAALLSGFANRLMVRPIPFQGIDCRFKSCFVLTKAKDCPGMLLKALNATLVTECGPQKLARWMWLFGERT